MVGPHSDLVLWHRSRVRAVWHSYWLAGFFLVLLPAFFILLGFLGGLVLGLLSLIPLMLPWSGQTLSPGGMRDMASFLLAVLIALPLSALLVIYAWHQLGQHFLRIYFQRWNLIDRELGLMLIVLDPLIYYSVIRAAGDLPPRGNPTRRTSFYSHLDRVVADAHLFPPLAGYPDPMFTFTRRTYHPVGCLSGGCCLLLVALALGFFPLALAGSVLYFGTALIHRLNQLALREYLVFRLVGSPEAVASPGLRRIAWRLLEEEGVMVGSDGFP